MNSVKLFDTQSKYFLRQKKDIAHYGKKKAVKRFGVPFALVQEITPNRRLSKKPIKLSDPKYFIDKYEKQNPHITKFVRNWNQLSDAQKVNYIVKERYSELIINKIMNKIKDLEIENNYGLNLDGEIVSFDKGDEHSVNLKNYRTWFFGSIEKDELDNNRLSSRSVHNHPSLLEEFSNYIMKHHPNDIDNIGEPLSHKDVANCYGYGKVSYVIDTFNHKYKYTPFRNYCIIFPLVSKIKSFISKQQDLLSNKISDFDKELKDFIQSNHDNDDKEQLASTLYEKFYQYYMQNHRNLRAKTDHLYALSDIGKYEQLK